MEREANSSWSQPFGAHRYRKPSWHHRRPHHESRAISPTAVDELDGEYQPVTTWQHGRQGGRPSARGSQRFSAAHPDDPDDPDIMPLHLLGKKSWNVYNPKAIEQVQRDEAAAKRREEDEEQRLEVQDAAVRNARLRGITPPTFADQDVHLLEHGPQRMNRRDDGDCSRPEKRRRRAHGEDETDAEMRFAQEATREDRDQSHRKVVMSDRDRSAPLLDAAGHVQLFTQPDEREMRKRDAEASRKRRKQQDAEKLQPNMRFKDAAGLASRQSGDGRSWHTSSDTPVPSQGKAFDNVPENNVWGNEDLGRRERAQVRLSSSDPLAAMNAGVAAVRKHEAEKLAWKKERQSELADLKQDQKRRSRERDEPGAQHKEQPSKRDGQHRHRHHYSHRTEQRDRSRSRSPRRHSHQSHEDGEHRRRSRSPRRHSHRSHEGGEHRRRSRSPRRHSHRSHEGEEPRRRSRSPRRHSHRSHEGEEPRRRSRSPRRHSHRSHEGEEHRRRSRSPRRAEYRSRDEGERVRSRTRDDRE